MENFIYFAIAAYIAYKMFKQLLVIGIILAIVLFLALVGGENLEKENQRVTEQALAKERAEYELQERR